MSKTNEKTLVYKRNRPFTWKPGSERAAPRREEDFVVEGQALFEDLHARRRRAEEAERSLRLQVLAAIELLARAAQSPMTSRADLDQAGRCVAEALDAACILDPEPEPLTPEEIIADREWKDEHREEHACLDERSHGNSRSEP
jgi:hypothetical protein